MTDIVERVARALYERDPLMDQETDLDGWPAGPVYTIPWDSDGLSEDVRDEFRADARAAIAAMLEPTEGMVEAGGGRYVNLERADDQAYEPPAIYRAMIQAAIEEKG